LQHEHLFPLAWLDSLSAHPSLLHPGVETQL
jgi:hypothetical protein